jgi:hypothetical protein
MPHFMQQHGARQPDRKPPAEQGPIDADERQDADQELALGKQDQRRGLELCEKGELHAERAQALGPILLGREPSVEFIDLFLYGLMLGGLRRQQGERCLPVLARGFQMAGSGQTPGLCRDFFELARVGEAAAIGARQCAGFEQGPAIFARKLRG